MRVDKVIAINTVCGFLTHPVEAHLTRRNSASSEIIAPYIVGQKVKLAAPSRVDDQPGFGSPYTSPFALGRSR